MSASTVRLLTTMSFLVFAGVAIERGWHPAWAIVAFIIAILS